MRNDVTIRKRIISSLENCLDNLDTPTYVCFFFSRKTVLILGFVTAKSEFFMPILHELISAVKKTTWHIYYLDFFLIDLAILKLLKHQYEYIFEIELLFILSSIFMTAKFHQLQEILSTNSLII